MTPLDLAPDAPAEAIAHALKEPAFAALEQAGAPLIVAAAERHLVTALNQPAAELFGGNFADVSRRLFTGQEPGARRLATLADTLAPNAPARLERLRFAVGARSAPMTMLCRKVSSSDAPDLLVLGIPSTGRGPRRCSPATALPETTAAAPERGSPMSRPHRFAWRTDAEGLLLAMTDELARRRGTAAMGVPLVSGSPGESALAQALVARKTFAGLHTALPGETSADCEWGGMPQFDSEGVFNGFRGYAVTHAPLFVTTEAGPEAAPASGPDVTVTSDQTDDGETRASAPDAAIPANVVRLHPAAAGEAEAPLSPLSAPRPALSEAERTAFDEIARTLSANAARNAEAEAEMAATPAAPPHDPMRDLVDLIPIGILVIRDGTALFANRTLLDVADVDDLEAFMAAGGVEGILPGLPTTPSDDNVTLHVLTDGGEMLPVDARVQAMAWEGAPATLVSLRRALDTTAATQLKTLERTVREHEGQARELTAILDTATDGVVVLDASGSILSLNRSAEALLGLEAGDVAGQSFEALVADESRSPVADYLAGLRSGGVASVLNDGREIRCRGPREGTIPVFLTVGRMGFDEAPKYCAVLRDLTAWKQAEQRWSEARSEAERASALKSDFLARVSHEIRTPLNAILGFAEVIMDERFGPVGNERYRDYMKDIHRSGEHVMSLVNDLLDLSKIEAGKMDMTFTTVDANALVSECVSLMQPGASRARVVMRLSMAPRLPRIVVDERALKQIVLNLLSNAVKYNEPGGQVIVSTACTDAGHAVVRIRDTGVGMSETDLQTALEPFGQINTSRAATGTGLGLPLTKALAEANYANFTIKSRKGEGTLVEVSFPANRVMAE